MMLRDDVEDGRAGNLVRMIEAHAVDYARAAIVAGRIVPPQTREQLATFVPVKL